MAVKMLYMHSVCSRSYTHLPQACQYTSCCTQYTWCILNCVLTYKESCHKCIRSWYFSWPILKYTAVSRKVQQKRTRQKKVLRVMGFLVIDWGFRFFSDKERNSTNKCIYAWSFLVGEHPWTSVNERQTRSTHNSDRHCRIRFCAFVGQPLSKQRYIRSSAVCLSYTNGYTDCVRPE